MKMGMPRAAANKKKRAVLRCLETGRLNGEEGAACLRLSAPRAGPLPGPPPEGVKELGSGPSFLERCGQRLPANNRRTNRSLKLCASARPSRSR